MYFNRIRRLLGYGTVWGGWKESLRNIADISAVRHAKVAKNAFGYWILVNPIDENLAWSGSTWVKHNHGMGTEDVQVSNLPTKEEAVQYAERVGLGIIE